jgi:toxin ParE1/3/4
MNVEYSNRAVVDLRRLAAESRQEYGDLVAAELEAYLRKIISQLANDPMSRPPVFGRRGVHAAALVRYPYKLFYRVFDDRVRILHIRHTAQRPWERD